MRIAFGVKHRLLVDIYPDDLRRALCQKKAAKALATGDIEHDMPAASRAAKR